MCACMLVSLLFYILLHLFINSWDTKNIPLIAYGVLTTHNGLASDGLSLDMGELSMVLGVSVRAKLWSKTFKHLRRFF